jgi:hypothetical protein
MKHSLVLAALVGSVALAACGKKEEPAPVPAPAPVVAPAPAPATSSEMVAPAAAGSPAVTPATPASSPFVVGGTDPKAAEMAAKKAADDAANAGSKK